MRRKPQPAPVVSSSALPLPERGARAMTEGKWREAVECFKQLVKQEPDAGWEQKLAEAYGKRAWELADKGMPKEAVVLLENAARLEPDRPPPALHFECLLRAERLEALGALFFKHEKRLSEGDPALASNLRELVALLLLAGALPERGILAGSLWGGWLATAQSALDAFAAGDEPLLETRLQAIPLRSPFKPLRLLLKGLFLTRTDPAKSRQLAESIPAGSPWSGFARMVADSGMTETELLPRLPHLSVHGRTFLASARGLDPTRLNRARELLIFSGEQLLRTLLQPTGREVIPLEEGARALCFALLAREANPGGFALFEKRFGPLDPLEKHRLQALAAEQVHSLESLSHWRACLRLLEESPAAPERDLHLALILRRMAGHMDEHDHGNPEEMRLLEQSLKWDPEDRATHLRLLEMYKKNQDDKGCRRILDGAVRRFPTDPEVLHAAVQDALAHQAFKKASGLAKKLLELDPLHGAVRQDLIRACLLQARKQVKARRLDLATREVEQAAAFERADARGGLIHLYQGFLKQLTGEESAGEALVQEGVRLVGGGVVGWFRATAEGRALDLPVPMMVRLTSKLREALREKPQQESVLHLVSAATSYLADRQVDVAGLLSLLADWLRPALKLELPMEGVRALCLLLLDSRQFPLLAQWSAKGARSWPGHPLFAFCQIAAKSRDDPDRLTWGQSERLEELLDQAQELNDRELVRRITDLLGVPLLPPGAFAAPFGEGDEDGDILPPFGAPLPIPKHVEANMVGELASLARELMREAPGRYDRRGMKEAMMEFLGAEGGIPPILIRMGVLDPVLEKALDRAGLPRAATPAPGPGQIPPPPPVIPPPAPPRPRKPKDDRQLQLDFDFDKP